MATLPLELIINFEKIAARGSITRAAIDLAVSKATVSKHLSELETRLGVILFARTTRALTLTAAGQKAYGRARAIMDEADLLFDEAQESRASPSGYLKIAAPQAFSQLWLADILPSFIAAYPDIELEIAVDDRTVDLIQEGFDAALRISAMPDSSLTARQLAKVRLHLVGAPSYWQKSGYPTHPDDLVHHNCIRYANLKDQSNWRFADALGNQARVRVRGSLTLNGGGMEMPSLCAGVGIAVLPDFAVCHDVRAGKLETVMPDWHSPELTLHLLTPPGRGKPKRLEVFTDFLVSHFGGKIPPWKL
jgi:DNA-binding transcriptional LysR family regulator